MNLVGKIFVVLILVMSVMFAAFSIVVYSTHKNWRDEIMRTSAEVHGNQTVGWKERYNKKEEENANLRNERDAMEKEKNAINSEKIQALAKAEAVINDLRTESTNAVTQLSAKDKELAANTEALHKAQENLSLLTNEVQKLRNEIASSQKETDEQIKRATELSDKLAVASGTLSVIKERNDQLTTEVANAKRLLSAYGKSVDDPSDATNIPVRGIITVASRRNVELSIGTDDGVRVGQELDIYRADKYVGRIRVTKAEPDSAVGENLTEYQQYPIQRGDNVGSELRTRPVAFKGR